MVFFSVKCQDLLRTRIKTGLIGIEIEMEGEGLPYLDHGGWVTTRDGSLRGESAEYVLRTPIQPNKVSSKLSYLYKNFKDSGCVLSPSNRCGTHIHLNIQQLTVKQMLNIVLLYYLFEDLLIEYCGEDRIGNLFCLSSKDAHECIRALNTVIRIGTLRHISPEKHKYSALNLSSLKKFGSIEFRSLETPKDVRKINNWVNLLSCLYNYGKDIDDLVNVIEGISQGGAEELVHNVFGEYVKYLNLNNVDSKVFYSLRLIQIPIYTMSRAVKSEERYIAASGNKKTTLNWAEVDLQDLDDPHLDRAVRDDMIRRAV